VKINSPRYASGEGSDTVAAFAMPEHNAGRLYVTNGTFVQASTNAGCNWDHIYPAPSPAQPANTQVISHLAAPGPKSLWVVSYDLGGELSAAARPHVAWIEDATLDREIQDGVERWSLQLAFRPGRPIDVREAVAAASVLSLTEDQRLRYVVTCQTLQDCKVSPRFAR